MTSSPMCRLDLIFDGGQCGEGFGRAVPSSSSIFFSKARHYLASKVAMMFHYRTVTHLFSSRRPLVPRLNVGWQLSVRRLKKLYLTAARLPRRSRKTTADFNSSTILIIQFAPPENHPSSSSSAPKGRRRRRRLRPTSRIATQRIQHRLLRLSLVAYPLITDDNNRISSVLERLCRTIHLL